jgi:hypothetical protein
MPRLGLMLVLLSFLALMGFDGVNSYAEMIGLPHLYEPSNILRVVTGTLNGLMLGTLVYPVLNQTLWRDWQDRPVLGRYREIGLLVLIAGAVITLLLAGPVVVLYPLALLSAVGVLMMLTALDTTVLLLVFRRANRAATGRQAVVPLLAGFTLAVVQVALVDAARFAIFQTWGGLPL